MWIKRDLSKKIQALSPNFIGILTGPRQTGKSALLFKLLGEGALFLECDDLDVRLRLNSDPSLMLGELKKPILIDEAQYCPNLFPELKLRVDRAKREKKILPAIWLTGSNQTLMHEGIRESLAGRAQYFQLQTFSIHELGSLFQLDSYFWKGGWPEFYQDPTLEPVQYLDDYIRTFVERDIAASAGIEKIGEFLLSLKLLASRLGQLLNASEIGSHAGVKGETLQNWIHLLERNGILSLVQPYFTNLNKRLIRSPKIYFNEVALATRLQGWRAIEPLLLSPQIGFLFENMVFSELLRCKEHLSLGLDLFHYRTKEGEEVDFLIRGQSKTKGELWLAIEVKFARSGKYEIKWPKNLVKDLKVKPTYWVVTASEKERSHTVETSVVPIHQLSSKLQEWLD